jgi:hypothetical protein
MYTNDLLRLAALSPTAVGMVGSANTKRRYHMARVGNMTNGQ